MGFEEIRRLTLRCNRAQCGDLLTYKDTTPENPLGGPLGRRTVDLNGISGVVLADDQHRGDMVFWAQSQGWTVLVSGALTYCDKPDCRDEAMRQIDAALTDYLAGKGEFPRGLPATVAVPEERTEWFYPACVHRPNTENLHNTPCPDCPAEVIDDQIIGGEVG